MSAISDVAQLATSLASVAVAGVAVYHARRVDHAVNGRPNQDTTISEDVSSIEARGVRDDSRRREEG